MNLGAAFRDYEADHRSLANNVCHFVGIPAITAAVLGGAARVQLPAGDLGMVILAASLALDLWLEWRLALPVLVGGIGLYLLGAAAPPLGLAALFLGGWGFQLVGHSVFERNRPAFARNPLHFFIGPRWIVNRVVRIVRV